MGPIKFIQMIFSIATWPIELKFRKEHPLGKTMQIDNVV